MVLEIFFAAGCFWGVEKNFENIEGVVDVVSGYSGGSYEDPTYETCVVFPNPVRPDYTGPVTIQGIRYNSDVKITDAAGNLVYKTTSNGGTATWNCQSVNGDPVSTGVYFIWTATNNGKDKKVGKVLVVK